MGARWTRLVTRRPLLTVLAVLAGLARPRRSPRRSCSWRCPTTPPRRRRARERQAYDLISENFGPGLNGPLVVLVEDLDPATAQQSVGAIAAAIGGTPTGTPGEFQGGLDDVAFAAPTLLPDGTTAIVTVIPESGPQEEATNALVADLRDLAPDLEAADRRRPRRHRADRGRHRRLRPAGRRAAALRPRRRRPRAGAAPAGLPLDPRADQGRRSGSCCRSAPRSAPSSPSSSGAGSATCSASRPPAR